MKYFDAHTHVQFAAFDDDREKVIERALTGGVWLINVGTQKDTSKQAIEIAEKYPEGVYAAIGLHPIHTSKSYHDSQELGGGEAAKEFTSRGEDFDFKYYRELGAHKKVVAVGECGLDYYRLDEATKAKQKEVFLNHIALAHELGKPLMIHCREAFGDLSVILNLQSQNLNRPDPGVVHFFSGTIRDADELLKLGFSFTFGGVITFPPRKGKSAGGYDEVVRHIPIERILSETDAPYVAPAPHRGKRNEPSYVVEAVKKLAELRGISLETAAEKIFENAKRIFSLTA